MFCLLFLGCLKSGRELVLQRKFYWKYMGPDDSFMWKMEIILICKCFLNVLFYSEISGETLLSPLVMCGPHGLKFSRPVELRLPHAASVSPNTWSFALKSSDTPTGQPTQWTNLALSDAPHTSHVGANCVSVLVDHFWRPMWLPSLGQILYYLASEEKDLWPSHVISS